MRTTVLVTGATAGIGYHTALGLAARGARVFVTGRDRTRGEQALTELRRQAGHENVELLLADSSSVRENVALADQLGRRVDHLDVLVNNAGRVFPQRRESADGYEATLALNFVGPVTLTKHLLPLLEQSSSARVISVVSSAYRMWKRDPFEDLQATERYVGLEAHAHAKLLNMLFTLGLARQLQGRAIMVNAVNPGMAWTPGTQSLTREAVPQWRSIWPVVRWFQRRAPADRAARAVISLATDSTASSGRYYEGIKESKLPLRLLDPATQDRAMQLGESLVVEALSRKQRLGVNERSSTRLVERRATRRREGRRSCK